MGIPLHKPIKLPEKAHNPAIPLIHATAQEHRVPGVNELRKAYFSGRTLAEKITALRTFAHIRSQALRNREAQLNATERAFENFYLFSRNGIRFNIDINGVHQTAFAQLTVEAAKRKLRAYTKEAQPHTLYFEKVSD